MREKKIRQPVSLVRGIIGLANLGEKPLRARYFNFRAELGFCTVCQSYFYHSKRIIEIKYKTRKRASIVSEKFGRLYGVQRKNFIFYRDDKS